MTYQQLKEHINGLDIKPFERDINKEVMAENLKSYADGSFHVIATRGKDKEHHLQKFRKIIETFEGDRTAPDAIVELIWRYCPECGEVRNKSLIGYSNPENHAYVRDLIDKGVIVI